MSTTATIRVGVVGAGTSATRHLEILAGMADVDVVGIAARRPESVSPLADRFGAKPYSDAAEMIGTTRPDALFICVPPDVHGPAERAAIQRDIPFLVEKPLARDWATAARLAASIERRGLLAAAGYQWRYRVSVERARELLAGARVVLAHGSWLSSRPSGAWWGDPTASGGQMIEQTTHLFDLARLLLGEAVEVFAMTGGSAGADASVALVRFASGPVASFASTSLAPPQHGIGLHVVCEGRTLEIGLSSMVVETDGRRTTMTDADDSTARQDRAFIEAVRSGDRDGVRSPYADALRSHRLATLAAASARMGRRLTVPGRPP